MLTWQELWSYARGMLRWWPLLIVTTLLAAGTAAFLARSQPDSYRARASLMIGNNFEVATPDRFAVEVSNSLARYYEVLVRREVIMRPAAEQLGLPFHWELLYRMLATEINPQANLLEIVIVDSDPQRAAAIANALADQLIAYSPNAAEKVAAQQAEVQRQIGETQAAIEETDRRLTELRERQSQLNAAVDLRENQDQIDELEKARERYQVTFTNLLALQDNADVNSLAYFERATPPSVPLPTKTPLIIAVAGLAGLLAGCAAAAVLDLLDDRWRPEAHHRRQGIRVLGGLRYDSGPGKRSAYHERDVRETHAQLVLAANGRPPRALLVSSQGPSEARSEFAIDLADAFGQTGHQVLLVDAELVHPYVSRIIEQRRPETAAPSSSAIELWAGNNTNRQIPPELRVRLRPTHMSNVVLLPGKAHDDGQPILVPLLHWPELVNHLRYAADVVIFDGPSALTSADAALLAPLVDGVVLVLDPRETTRSQLEEMKTRLLHNPEARLLGAVAATTTRSPQRRRKGRFQGRFALNVDRGGLTITLPTRARVQPLLTEGGERHAAKGPAPAGWVEPRPVRQGPRDPMLDELLETMNSEQERAVGDPRQSIVTPPPQRVIITPTPAIMPLGHESAARRSIARPRGGRQRYRPSADKLRPAQGAGEGEEQP